MLVLKQSTSIDIRVGPFMDTDGVTAVTGQTLGAADQAEVLKANGAATAAMAGTFAAVTGADGWYDYTVAAGDVDTVGEVVFVVQDADVHLPVFVRGQVVEAETYDALFGASPTGFSATGEVTVGSIATDAITAASIAANAIGAAELATDCIASDQLAATAVTDIWAKVIESQGSYTAQQAMSICLSVLAGVTSSGGDVLETPDGVATRVTATVDGSNNRTAMTLTPSS